MKKQLAISGQPSALERLVARCNEMDITEQLNWLGDAIMPHEAAAELRELQLKASASIDVDKWSICATHGGYMIERGCPWCSIEAIDALITKWRTDPALWLANDKQRCANELEAVLRGEVTE